MTEQDKDVPERERIIAALVRIMRGQAERSSGRISVKAVAEEAGLARTALTHRHLDLKELVELCAARPMRDTSNERRRIDTLVEEMASLRELNDRLAEQVTLAALVRPVVARGLVGVHTQV